jgi:hypothetical protein
MSKINYCSLDEAWGDPGKNMNDNLISTNSSSNANSINNIQQVQQENEGQRQMVNAQKNTNNDKIYGRTNYDYLNENSKIDRNNVIQNMNKVERNLASENINENTVSNYNKYRFNPRNNVKQNNYDKDYSPFKESIEKKQLQDKIDYLESEFNKYKLITSGESSEETSNRYIENFNNQNQNTENEYNNNSGNNDIVDLIILIIIGLIVIFIMNSIFNIGKAIGARNKMI